MRHIVNRFSFDVIMAGFLRVVDNPGLYSKYKPALEAELFFYNDISPNSKGIRKLIEWFHEMMKAKKTDSPSIVAFRDYINSYVLDSEPNKAAKDLLNQSIANPKIQESIRDDGSFDLFLDYLRLIRFIKHSNVMFDEYQTGNVDKASELMKKTITEIEQIQKLEDVIFDFDKDFDKLILSRQLEQVKTLYLGCTSIDSAMGGFEERTFNVFMSSSGGGKSMMNHHLIKRAIRQKYSVHVTCVEDRPKSFIRKLVACLTGIPINVLKDFTSPNSTRSPTSSELNLIQAAKAEIKQYVKVDFLYGQSLEAVHQRKKEYDYECKHRDMPKPIVDIVDYTAHISAKAIGDKMYEQMRHAYGQRKDYALSTGKICFDFAQVNREGAKNLGQEKSLSMTDLAGSFDLAQVCDNIISINRSALNIENHTAKLKIVKARDGENNHEFEVKTNFGSAQYLMDDEDTTWLTGRAKDVIAFKKG